MRRLLAFLLITGCAHAPRPAYETDPFACAQRIARSIPVSGERSMLLNDIAISATPCGGSTPRGFWAHDPAEQGEAREALRRAYSASVRKDTATVRREALRAFRAPLTPDRAYVRGNALEWLLDFGAYETVLDRLAAEPGLRVDGCDADRWRAEVASRAARAGDTAAAVRAIRSCTTEAGRARADCWARHGRVVPFALAAQWDRALDEARATRDCRAECRVLQQFALARAAEADRRTALADSLIAELLVSVKAGGRFGSCDMDRAWSYDVVGFLAQTGRVAQAESLLAVAHDGLEPLGWMKLAIVHRERRDHAAAARAIARAHAENERADVGGWGASFSYSVMADTLLAGGWPEEAGRAQASAVLAARRVPDASERAIALAGVAASAETAQADTLVREALHGLVGEADPVRQARALGRVGAGARAAKVGFDEEERGWFAAMANARPVWKATLSE